VLAARQEPRARNTKAQKFSGRQEIEIQAGTSLGAKQGDPIDAIWLRQMQGQGNHQRIWIPLDGLEEFIEKLRAEGLAAGGQAPK